MARRRVGGGKRTGRVRTVPLWKPEVRRWIERKTTRIAAKKVRYLDPKNRRYPVTNPDGTYNMDMINKAIALAGMHGHTDIERKARALKQRLVRRYGEKVKRIPGLGAKVRAAKRRARTTTRRRTR